MIFRKKPSFLELRDTAFVRTSLIITFSMVQTSYSSGGSARFKPKYCPSSEEHLRTAFVENVRKDDDPKVLSRLEAGREARAQIDAGNYAALVEALRGYQERELPDMTTFPWKRVTAEDFVGSKPYTTRTSISRFKNKYGFEPASVGLVIPEKKWIVTVDENAPPAPGQGSSFLVRAGLAAKLGEGMAGGMQLSTQYLRVKPYAESGVIVINSSMASRAGKEHELLHSTYETYSKHLYHVKHSPRVTGSRGEKYELLLMSEIEDNLISEISAFRAQVAEGEYKKVSPLKQWENRWEGTGNNGYSGQCSGRHREWNNIMALIKENYLRTYESFHVSEGYDPSQVHKTIERAVEKLEPAVRAVEQMEDAGIPEQVISRMLMAVGSTPGEISRGEFHSPFDDVAAWGDYVNTRLEKGLSHGDDVVKW